MSIELIIGIVVVLGVIGILDIFLMRYMYDRVYKRWDGLRKMGLIESAHILKLGHKKEYYYKDLE